MTEHEDADCPICFDNVPNHDMLRLHPCRHLFCRTCTARWLEKSLRCPSCRTTILATSPSRDPDDAHSDTIVCQFENSKEHAGITLEGDGPVRVTRLSRKGVAYRSGIRRNDTILAINNIPCIGHEHTVRMWDAARERAPQRLICRVKKRGPWIFSCIL